LSPNLANPADPGQIQVGQTLPELGRLFPDRGEDECPHRDDDSDHRQERQNRSNRAGHSPLEESDERLEQEDDPGGEGDRQPDDANRPGNQQQHIAECNRPHCDPDDQCDALQSLREHGFGV
jgi:hypothetical protein